MKRLSTGVTGGKSVVMIITLCNNDTNVASAGHVASFKRGLSKVRAQ